MRQPRRNRGQQGAVIVEAALILPIMLLIVFAIVEYGLLFTSYSTNTASTRSAARLAATSYAIGITSEAEPGELSAIDQIALAATSDLKVFNNAVPVGMTIYRVDPTSEKGAPHGGQFPGPDMVGGCPANSCLKFTWNEGQARMVYQSGKWTNPQACAQQGNIDEIGVFVQSEHTFLTGLVGKKWTVNSHTVMRLEPIPTDMCI